MGSKSVRASASETESKAPESKQERAPSKREENSTGGTKTDERHRGAVLRYGESGASIQQSSGSGETPIQRDIDGSVGGYVDYDDSGHGALSERYGIDFAGGDQAQKLQRLEDEFGGERVSGWVDEGMTVETMGKPRDMQAFRERQQRRSGEVPTDIERQNQATLQRNAARDGDGRAGEAQVPDAVRGVVSSSGRSLSESVQREMEDTMGDSFGDVRVHTGVQAAAAADEIGARAFTVGNHIAFNRGEYDPESTAGREVLAHELTHVRQDTGGAVSMLPKAETQLAIDQDPTLEREAEQVAREVTDGSRTDNPDESRTVSPDESRTVSPDESRTVSPDESRTVSHRGTEMHVQPKLEVSSPSDPAEKEAERVAEAVMKMDEPDTASTGESELGEEGEESENIDRTQREVGLVRTVPIRRTAGGGGGAVPEGSEDAVHTAVQGGGKPLPADTRSSLESKMGVDFSDVSVHTGPEADEAARSINARAFTIGNDIAFAKGNYAPDSKRGKKLLAHELTHVVQQGQAPQAHRSLYRARKKKKGKKKGGKRGGKKKGGGKKGGNKGQQNQQQKPQVTENLGEVDSLEALQGYILALLRRHDSCELEVEGTIPVTAGASIKIKLAGEAERENEDGEAGWEFKSELAIGGSINLGAIAAEVSFNGNVSIETPDASKFGSLFKIAMRESIDTALESSGISSEGIRNYVISFIFDEDDVNKKKEEMDKEDQITIGVGGEAEGEAGSVDDGAGAKAAIGGGRAKQITSEGGSSDTKSDGKTKLSGKFEAAVGGYKVEIGYEYEKADSDDKGEHKVAIGVPLEFDWTSIEKQFDKGDIASKLAGAIVGALKKYDELAAQFESLPTLGLGEMNVDLKPGETKKPADKGEGKLTGAAELEFTTDPFKVQKFKAELLAVGEIEFNGGVFKISGGTKNSVLKFQVSF